MYDIYRRVKKRFMFMLIEGVGFALFVVQLKSCQVIRSDVIKGAPGAGVES